MIFFSLQQLKEQKVAGSRTNEVGAPHIESVCNLLEFIMIQHSMVRNIAICSQQFFYIVSARVCVTQGPLIVTEELHSLSFESELQVSQSGLNIKLEVTMKENQ